MGKTRHRWWKVVPRAPRDLPPGPDFFWFFRRARSFFDSILGPGMYFKLFTGPVFAVKNEKTSDRFFPRALYLRWSNVGQ
jgi:hypothetical protein